jgi:hypothetical protein
VERPEGRHGGGLAGWRTVGGHVHREEQLAKRAVVERRRGVHLLALLVAEPADV